MDAGEEHGFGAEANGVTDSAGAFDPRASATAVTEPVL
jgi:hypothetical protein